MAGASQVCSVTRRVCSVIVDNDSVSPFGNYENAHVKSVAVKYKQAVGTVFHSAFRYGILLRYYKVIAAIYMSVPLQLFAKKK